MPPRRRKPPRAGALADLPPLSILRSILLLQVSYYVVATVLILFTTLVAGQKFSVGLVLDWRTVRGDNTVGWMLGVDWLLVSLFAYAASLPYFDFYLLAAVLVILLLTHAFALGSWSFSF